MRQILFITDERLTALLWQGSQLIAKYEFESSEKSLADLKQHLDVSKNIPTSIILDLLEEEITLTTMPHVALHERKFLIDRTLTRMFRSSSFTSAKIVGRENNLRKDDRLLVSGLTTDEPLLKWLDVINQYEVMIKGIHSLPLITDNILKVLKQNQGLTLLVSRQSNSFIRQSIFKDGKLLYSRNIPSSQHFNNTMISSDLQKTRKYLENQKLLAANDSIDVVILTSQQFYAELAGLDELLPDMSISYIRYESLKKSLGIESEYVIGGREVFASLLLSVKPKNNYARKSDLERYTMKKQMRLINISSIVASLLLMLFAAKFYIDIGVIDNKLDGLENQVNSLRQHNDKMASDMDRLPVNARQMKLFVENISDVRLAAKTDVEQSMVKISQVFNAYSDISLQNMNWYLRESDYNNSKNRNPGSRRTAMVSAPSSADDAQLIVVVASIDFSLSDKQTSMKKLEHFIASVKSIKSVKTVTLTKQPIKAASTDNIAGVMAANKKDQAEFAFTIIMEEKFDAG